MELLEVPTAAGLKRPAITLASTYRRAGDAADVLEVTDITRDGQTQTARRAAQRTAGVQPRLPAAADKEVQRDR